MTILAFRDRVRVQFNGLQPSWVTPALSEVSKNLRAMEDACYCSLFTRSPFSFSHEGTPCGWPDLALVCPDCGKEGDSCSFFSENVEGNGCSGFTRLVALCIRCQFDQGKRRIEAQLRQRVVILSGGESSQRGVAFAAGHVLTYKDGVKVVDGIWLPQDLSTPDTEFFWDRTTTPWRFLLTPRTGAEPVTMRGLLGVLGLLAEVPDDPPPSQTVPDVTALAAQVQELTRTVQLLAQSATGQPGVGYSGPEAAQAAEALKRVQATSTSKGQPASGAAWNPSQTFNLGVQSGSGVVLNQSNDVALAQVLASQGATAEQIMAFLQTRATGSHVPTEHRAAWFQVLEGTSPLCVYTGLHGETRMAATAKVLHVQTQDGTNKLTMKLSIWPPARAEDVAIYAMRELGDDWKRGLMRGNTRLMQITPAADRPCVPQIPLEVDRFLEQCYSCLRVYDHVSVLRAWESAHTFMIDECVTKRSQPSWDSLWMMPVFQVELKRTARSAEGTFDVKKCCVNWNLRKGQKCNKDPDPACTLLHLCMRCGSEHRICECARE